MKHILIMQLPIKYESITQSPPHSGKRLESPIYPASSLLGPSNRWTRWLFAALISVILVLTLWIPYILVLPHELKLDIGHGTSDESAAEQVVRRYNITVGARWMNLGQFSGTPA